MLIEVLEEKTSSADKLEYGITGSNYCKLSLLNENYKFFDNKNYGLLRKNRTIKPAVRCNYDGNADNENDGYSPLGTFYSDEWKLSADSHFMTVKAYDILYSLQTLNINYGMDGGWEGKEIVSGQAISIAPYKNQSIKMIITRVEKLINEERIRNGILGSAIKIEPKGFTTNFLNSTIPYTLIEEKSAWDVLKDIGVLCCAFVYVDRAGTIVIERDDFGEIQQSADKNSGVVINESNAFSYSLPVTSKTVVNKVSIEYYDIVENTDTDSDKITINAKDINRVDGGYEAVISLPKVYEMIEKLTISVLSKFTLKFAAYNKLTIRFANSVDKLIININEDLPKPKSYKLEKNTYTKQEEFSINRYGLNEFTSKCSNFLLRCLPTDINIPSRITDNVNKILSKYSEGVSYLESDWKGSDALEVSKYFAGEDKTYECFSNDIKLDTKFRAKTKGREKIARQS